jgi:hypothetical protein
MTGVDDHWLEGEQNYRAFLLRCWQENELQNEGEPTNSCSWRFALVHIGQEQEQGFACLDELLIFLSREFASTDSLVHSTAEE